MIALFEPPPDHHGCMDCGKKWEPGEMVRNDWRGGPGALACNDREACEERQRQRDLADAAEEGR